MGLIGQSRLSIFLADHCLSAQGGVAPIRVEVGLPHVGLVTSRARHRSARPDRDVRSWKVLCGCLSHALCYQQLPGFRLARSER